MGWQKLLESITESVNDPLWLRNDYLLAANRILRHQSDGRVQLTDSERQELAERGAKLGQKALAEITVLTTPDIILAWKRKFADQKMDTSKHSKSVGRPNVDKDVQSAPLCTWLLRDHRERLLSGMGKVVRLPVGNHRRIRDGPLRRR